MTILDPGHLYMLRTLDGGFPNELRFVKRVGEKYPGNCSAYAGTTSQEVLRALIDRAKYVNGQIYFPENDLVLWHLRSALWLLESRAARTHGRFLDAQPTDIETRPVCSCCLHIVCGRKEAA